MESKKHTSKRILLFVSVESACFNSKENGKFYVKISIDEENPLRQQATMTRPSKINRHSNNVRWMSKFALVINVPVPDLKRAISLRFEVFKARNFFPDSLVGVATYKLDTQLKNNCCMELSTDQNILIPCEHKTCTSLKIFQDKVSKGALNVEVVVRENISINGVAHDYFVLKTQDFMMPKLQ
ncbi:hypothetical protein HAX54_028543 [Datura stramonium]|uniref:C2 domain-containing protein n=1 Tax=Datura stramonium TaxID=4076 RepID=A0ABS8V722_DATST|nr:hypothetical protein [Datura stramonium]